PHPLHSFPTRRSSDLTSKRPFLDAMALVNAPFTWPKRVDSSRSVGIDPVLTGTNGLSRRGEFRWMALAITSFPVPLSPCNNTVEDRKSTRLNSSHDQI